MGRELRPWTTSNATVIPLTGRHANVGLPRGWISTLPVADRSDDVLGGVLLDVVAGAVQQHGLVFGKQLLPAAAFRGMEREVFGAPYDQRWPVSQPRQLALDLGKKRFAGEYCARGTPAPGRRDSGVGNGPR
jgi:hypothetical protein